MRGGSSISWQSTLTNFIWQYKSSWIKCKMPCQPRLRGGLALPNLKHYYEAMLLSKLLEGYSPKTFREILWMPQNCRPRRMTYSELLKAPLGVGQEHCSIDAYVFTTEDFFRTKMVPTRRRTLFLSHMAYREHH